MKSTIVRILICATWIVQIFAQNDIFASISEMEILVQTHSETINSIQSYIDDETKKMLLLKRLLVRYKKEQKKAAKNIPYYVQNPINSYSLIKRLTLDLDFIEEIIKRPHDYVRNNEVTYPDEVDLWAAAEALGRIQKTYKLNVTQLSRGILKSNYSKIHNTYVEKFTPMLSSDCFVVAKAMCENGLYEQALPWIMQAFNTIKSKTKTHYEPSSLHIMDYLELICFTYLGMGHINIAVKWIDTLLVLWQEYPEYNVSPTILEYRQSFKNIVDQITSPAEEEFSRNYHSLCRGDIEMPPNMAKDLSCRYQTESHPYLRLAPVKVEQLYADPAVLMYHDVLTQGEIETIKGIAMKSKKLRRSAIYASASGVTQIHNTRISKHVWLYDNESETVACVSRRVNHITRLSLDSAEALQVCNYGLGGYFNYHHDFVLKDDQVSEEGKRIATVLFYLSNVKQGGATVFVNLKLTVYPVKGAALFWLNLYDTGARDFRLKHAACPVLRGNKWAANKWLHESGQELIRPCPRRP